MPPFGNQSPKFEQKGFSSDVIENGNKVLQGISYFDSKIHVWVRVVMAAKREGLLGKDGKLRDLPQDLKEYLKSKLADGNKTLSNKEELFDFTAAEEEYEKRIMSNGDYMTAQIVDADEIARLKEWKRNNEDTEM